MRMTVSGDKSPCAVGKAGNVSQLAKTELESGVPLRESLSGLDEAGTFF